MEISLGSTCIDVQISPAILRRTVHRSKPNPTDEILLRLRLTHPDPSQLSPHFRVVFEIKSQFYCLKMSFEALPNAADMAKPDVCLTGDA
jgi:hypothetical protein